MNYPGSLMHSSQALHQPIAPAIPPAIAVDISGSFRRARCDQIIGEVNELQIFVDVLALHVTHLQPVKQVH